MDNPQENFEELEQDFGKILSNLPPDHKAIVEAYIQGRLKQAVINTRADAFTDKYGNLPTDGLSSMGQGNPLEESKSR